MPFTLAPGVTGDKFAAKQDVGTDVVCEINGDTRTISGSTDAYGSLFQGLLTTSATALIGPSAGADLIADSIAISNPGASTRIVTFYKTKNSTTYDATTQWGPAIRLLPGESAMWTGGAGWLVFNSVGLQKSLPSPLTTKGDIWTFGTSDARLGVSADGGVLVADSTAGNGLNYTVLSALGDLLQGAASAKPTRLAMGTTGQVLAVGASGGLKWVDPVLVNTSTSNQTGFASDTYLVGSSIAVPAGLVRAKTGYHLRFDMVKTAAGTATPIINIRFGTAGSTADTARLTFTFAAGTAAIDTGVIEVWVHFRTVGSGTSAVIVGVARITHALAVTGLTSTGASGTGIIVATSSGFDSTVANSIIGASFNGGTSFAGTNVLVQAEAFNLNV